MVEGAVGGAASGPSAEPAPAVELAPALVLQKFIAKQEARFYAYISDAVDSFTEHGQLPAPIFSEGATKGKGTKRKGKDGENGQVRAKRKASGFNHFVQQKMAEYKAKGIKPEGGQERGGYMKMAAAEWTALTADVKQKYMHDFAESQAAHEAGKSMPAMPALPGTAHEPSTTNGKTGAASAKKSEKKKKHKHKHHEGSPGGAEAAAGPDGTEKKKKKKKKKHREGDE